MARTVEAACRFSLYFPGNTGYLTKNGFGGMILVKNIRVKRLTWVPGRV